MALGLCFPFNLSPMNGLIEVSFQSFQCESKLLIILLYAGSGSRGTQTLFWNIALLFLAYHSKYSEALNTPGFTVLKADGDLA